MLAQGLCQGRCCRTVCRGVWDRREGKPLLVRLGAVTSLFIPPASWPSFHGSVLGPLGQGVGVGNLGALSSAGRPFMWMPAGLLRLGPGRAWAESAASVKNTLFGSRLWEGQTRGREGDRRRGARPLCPYENETKQGFSPKKRRWRAQEEVCARWSLPWLPIPGSPA